MGRNRHFWIVIAILLVLLILPSLVDLDANRIDLHAILLPPSRSHLLGTDENGRDVLRRLLQGAQATLGIAFAAATISVVLGSVLGALAASRGGLIDTLIMRATDLGMALPTLFVILLFTTLVTPGPRSLVLLIGLTGWMPVTRLVRGQTRSILAEPYVEGARTLGIGELRLLRRYLLPNVSAIIAVAALLQISRAILTETTISFLGLGIQPPASTWGNMLTGAQGYLLSAPWLAIFPGLAIVGTLLMIASLDVGTIAAFRPAKRRTRRTSLDDRANASDISDPLTSNI